MELGLLQALAVSVAGFAGSAIAFRIFIHESVSTEEATQAISTLATSLGVFFYNRHNAADGNPAFLLAQSILLLCLFQWTRRVQIQSPSGENAQTLDFNGKVVLITGGNSGIGLESAKFLLRKGATVIVASRNVELANKVFAQDVNNSGKLVVMRLDLESFASVREFATEFCQRFPKLDVLLLNAGSMMVERKITRDGWESMMQTNCFSTFLLALLLLKPLKQSTLSRGRIVCVSSSTAKLSKHIPMEDLNAEKFYNIFITYGGTKFAMNQLFWELDRKLDGKLTVNICHPGAIASDIVRNLHWFFREARVIVRPWFKNTLEGSHTQVYLCTNVAVENVSGKYFEHSQVHASHRVDRREAQLFFAKAEDIVGCKFADCWN